VRCDELEPLIEEIADGSVTPTPDQSAHLDTCPLCRRRVERARTIEQLLIRREVAEPSATFTAKVMAQVGSERWRAERVIDMGFNLAMAAGVLVILAGAAGLAWSLGFLTITIDVVAILEVLEGAEVSGRVLSQVQTLAMAAVLLTMALVLWWWAEAASD
jgi:anti-sigma factor RsiW